MFDNVHIDKQAFNARANHFRHRAEDIFADTSSRVDEVKGWKLRIGMVENVYFRSVLRPGFPMNRSSYVHEADQG